MTEITILTLNTQKMGPNSPSLTNIVTLLDRHTPDVLLLTETPPLSHQGALTQILRNRGYKTQYHLANAPPPTGTIPEARLPTHTTHGGGGCWIAHKKTRHMGYYIPHAHTTEHMSDGHYMCHRTHSTLRGQSGHRR